MPFDTENVSARVEAINVRQLKKGDDEIPLVELVLEVNPFTSKLAGELDPFVKSTLFTREEAELRTKVKAITFDLPIRPQQAAVRMASDQSDASFVIDDLRVASVGVTRTKKSSAWTLKLTVQFSPSGAKQLQQVVDCYLKSRYFTFANAEPGLWDQIDAEDRKKKATPARGQKVSEPQEEEQPLPDVGAESTTH